MKQYFIIFLSFFIISCGPISSESQNQTLNEELTSEPKEPVVEVPRVIERTFEISYPWGLREGLIYENGSSKIIVCSELTATERDEISELLNEGLQNYILGIETDGPLRTTASTIVEDDCHKREVYIREGIYDTHSLSDVRGHSIDSIVNCINEDGVTLDSEGPYFQIQSTCALLEKL